MVSTAIGGTQLAEIAFRLQFCFFFLSGTTTEATGRFLLRLATLNLTRLSPMARLMSFFVAAFQSCD
jgi:hypothetical protein